MARPAVHRDSIRSAFDSLTAEGATCTAYSLGKEARVSRIVARYWLRQFVREGLAMRVNEGDKGLGVFTRDPLA